MNMYIISGKNVACLYCLNVEPELQEFQACFICQVARYVS